MRIEFVPTEYAVHIGVVRGYSRSPKTWRVYGYCLLAYLRYVENCGIDWLHANEERLAHYRSHLEKKKLVRATIARSMNIICGFYEWAQSRGHILDLPFTREVVSLWSRGVLSHVERKKIATRPLLVPRVPRRRRYPRYFNREEQERIFAELCDRDRLIMEWALYTGAREFEICALTVDDVPAQSVYRSRRAYALKITGKGAVEADLCVPTWLLDRTQKYIRFIGRPDIVRSSRARGKQTPPNIFLSRWGDALQPDSLYRAFRSALQIAGLHGRFHDLRHTYAISTLHRLMQLPEHEGTEGLNAIMTLKYLMRHSSLTSTQVYLEARNFYLTEIYSDLFELPEYES